MRKRIAVFVSLLMAALGVSAVAAAPALAAPPPSCASTQLCVYVNTTYQTNQGYMLIPVGYSGQCVVLDPYRNAISSAWNSSGRDVRFYRDTSCSNDYKTLYNGTGNPKFSTHWAPTWDNSTDAVKFL